MIHFKESAWPILTDLSADARQRPPNRATVLPYRLNKVGIFLVKPGTSMEPMLAALRPKK
jgi:hypothetical protein